MNFQVEKITDLQKQILISLSRGESCRGTAKKLGISLVAFYRNINELKVFLNTPSIIYMIEFCKMYKII